MASITTFSLEDEFLGLHFVARSVKPKEARLLIDLARENGYTHIVMQLADAVELDSFPGVLRSDALSKLEFLQLVDYVKSSGLEFIPEVKLLTHQEKFLQEARAELMYNKTTYDPRQDEVYEIVFDYLNELIDLVKPTMIHIGHDEVAGLSRKFRKNRLRFGEKVLPSDLF